MKKAFAITILNAAVFFLTTACISLPFGSAQVEDQVVVVRADPGPRPTLGILPFAAIGADGETIATLFSHQNALLETFNVVPRTAALDVILAEHGVSFAESDAITSIVNLLNADYVLSGSIRRLGDRNLLIATIINVETFEMVAGYYRTYRNIGEAPDFLPAMARSLVDTFVRGAARGEYLAINSLRPQPGTSRQDAETLTEILAIELLHTGMYSILPRTDAIQSAIAEQEIQLSGLTSDGGAARIGHAANAELMLDGAISRLGDTNLFTAQILRVRDGTLVIGGNRNYNVITEGIGRMAEIAIILTEPDSVRANARIAERQQADRLRQEAEEAEIRGRQEEIERETRRLQAEAAAAAQRRQLEIDRERRREQRAVAARQRVANATRNERESFTVSYVMAENGARTGFSLGMFLGGLYWSPLPFTNIGVETRVTAISEGDFIEMASEGDPNLSWFGTISPTLGAVHPLGSGARVFVNGMLNFDFGTLPWESMIVNEDISDNFRLGLTPGFNAGISLGRRGTFTMKYSGALYQNTMSHSFSVGFGRIF